MLSKRPTIGVNGQSIGGFPHAGYNGVGPDGKVRRQQFPRTDYLSLHTDGFHRTAANTALGTVALPRIDYSKLL